MSFIPERFDPESEYFKSPSTGRARDQHSFIPFGIGMRNCPGQTMARLIQRVVLAYFVANIDFDINKEQLSNDKILFNDHSQFNLLLTINKMFEVFFKIEKKILLIKCIVNQRFILLVLVANIVTDNSYHFRLKWFFLCEIYT